MKVGDIHWVELPSAGGHEQQGRQPAVIAQDDAYASRVPTVLVIPLSLRTSGTAVRRNHFDTGDATKWLARELGGAVFQLRAVDRNRVGSRVGEVANPEKQAVFERNGQADGP